jgi:hypothetical protein
MRNAMCAGAQTTDCKSFRIGLRRLVAIVPTETAVALVALGFAETFDGGSLAASSAGRSHLDRHGISLVPRRTCASGYRSLGSGSKTPLGCPAAIEIGPEQMLSQ